MKYSATFPSIDVALSKGKELQVFVQSCESPLCWEGTLFLGPVLTANEFFRDQKMSTQESVEYIRDLLQYGIEGHADIETEIRFTGTQTLSIVCTAKNTRVKVPLSLTLNSNVSLTEAVTALKNVDARFTALESRLAVLEAAFARAVVEQGTPVDNGATASK